MMLDGTLCEGCGVYMDSDGEGYPRKCNDCQGAAPSAGTNEKTRCQVCGKTVKVVGLEQHVKAKHP
jgi:tRNA(Ile2) C34 agmatinyltransferase TiaS